jgi:signaling intermediate in Toll pathway protein
LLFLFLDVTNLETPFDESALQHVTQRSVHEQTEGTILAMAATGTSSRDSLLSWVRFLQQTNPALGTIPVLFSLTSPFGHVVPIAEAQDHQDLTRP